MELEPTKCVNGNLLFCPKLFDYVEIDFSDRSLRDGDTLLDIDSHIVFYSLVGSKKQIIF